MGEIGHIAVLGLGYVGLPTAAILASRKVRVTGVDIDPHTVATINEGRIHIVEPDLDIAVRAAVEQGYLTAQTEVPYADAFVIAVPTPLTDEKKADLRHVKAAAQAIAPQLRSGNIVILESTVPVGTTRQLAEQLADARPDLAIPGDVAVAHCPERVLPGKVLHELIHNDRLIGGLTPACAEQARSLYSLFTAGEMVVTEAATAEMAKLAENSFRDLNIAYANELSLLCDKQGVDVWEVVRLANRHPRVNILQPGPGVGGHCIAVDPWFLADTDPDGSPLIRAARAVNDAKPDWIVAKAMEMIAALPTPVTVACYGLSFKADIDDLRESPALAIARAMAVQHDGPLLIVEPHIDAPPNGLERAELVSLGQAARADLHILLVDHTAFRGARPVSGTILDCRGIWTQAR